MAADTSIMRVYSCILVDVPVAAQNLAELTALRENSHRMQRERDELAERLHQLTSEHAKLQGSELLESDRLAVPKWLYPYT
jgi:hypothetical protein